MVANWFLLKTGHGGAKEEFEVIQVLKKSNEVYNLPVCVDRRSVESPGRCISRPDAESALEAAPKGLNHLCNRSDFYLVQTWSRRGPKPLMVIAV